MNFQKVPLYGRKVHVQREASVPYFPGVQEGRGPESCAAAAERYPVENYLLSVYENPEKL